MRAWYFSIHGSIYLIYKQTDLPHFSIRHTTSTPVLMLQKGGTILSFAKSSKVSFKASHEST